MVGRWYRCSGTCRTPAISVRATSAGRSGRLRRAAKATPAAALAIAVTVPASTSVSRGPAASHNQPSS
jgi:hypothetical protein